MIADTSTVTNQVIALLNHSVKQVFATMLSLPLEQVGGVSDAQLPSFEERVTGSVGFGGEKVCGAVYVHLSGAFARRIACAMLGIEENEIESDAEVNDVLGEVCNMVTGGVKSSLCDLGLPCAASTPSIIRGTTFEIETTPSVHREHLVFESDGNPVVIEVHIEYV